MDAPKTEKYKLDYIGCGPLSQIRFPDVAHAMIYMQRDDTWLHKDPIMRYSS